MEVGAAKRLKALGHMSIVLQSGSENSHMNEVETTMDSKQSSGAAASSSDIGSWVWAFLDLVKMQPCEVVTPETYLFAWAVKRAVWSYTRLARRADGLTRFSRRVLG